MSEQTIWVAHNTDFEPQEAPMGVEEGFGCQSGYEVCSPDDVLQTRSFVLRQRSASVPEVSIHDRSESNYPNQTAADRSYLALRRATSESSLKVTSEKPSERHMLDTPDLSDAYPSRSKSGCGRRESIGSFVTNPGDEEPPRYPPIIGLTDLGALVRTVLTEQQLNNQYEDWPSYQYSGTVPYDESTCFSLSKQREIWRQRQAFCRLADRQNQCIRDGKTLILPQMGNADYEDVVEGARSYFNGDTETPTDMLAYRVLANHAASTQGSDREGGPMLWT